MEIVGIIISFIEILSMFLVYNILIRENIFDQIFKKVIFSIMTSILYSFLISVYSADSLTIFVGMIFLNSMIVTKVEKKDTIVTFIELIVSSLPVLVMELIVSFVIYVTMGGDEVSPVMYIILVSGVIATLIWILNTNKSIKKLNLSKFFSAYKGINIIILNLFVFFLFIKLLMANKLMETTIIIPITLLGLILVGVNCYFYAYLYNTLNERKKKEIRKSFNPLINDLLAKLKANEHEYRNHLNTIWSIAQVSEADEIRDKLKEYISSMVDDTEEFSMLLNVENTIIKAVLYNKSQRAEKLGVKYIYNIKSDLKDIKLDNSELTVVLSNLLNNAIEATSMIKKKELEINISEDDKRYIIEVKNRTEGVRAEDLSSMFKMGYSTKGEGRGYGLYNIKQIVDKNKGKIQMFLEEDIMNIIISFPR